MDLRIVVALALVSIFRAGAQECENATLDVLDALDFANETEEECGDVCRPVNDSCDHCYSVQITGICLPLDVVEDISEACCAPRTSPEVNGTYCGILGEVIPGNASNTSNTTSEPVNLTCTLEALGENATNATDDPGLQELPPSDCENDTIFISDLMDPALEASECGDICEPTNGSCSHCYSVAVEGSCFPLENVTNMTDPVCCAPKTRQDIDVVFCGVSAIDDDFGAELTNLTCNLEMNQTSGASHKFYGEHINTLLLSALFVFLLSYN